MQYILGMFDVMLDEIKCRKLRIPINFLLSFIFLLSGGLLYICFRENTYISIFASNYFDFEKIRAFASPISVDFTKYYLPDILWGLGLCHGLIAIFPAGTRFLYSAGALAFFCGVTWELLQLFGVIFGTGDVIDIMLYLTASVMAVLINIIFFRRTK